MHKPLSFSRRVAAFGLLLALGTVPLSAAAGSFTAIADATLTLVEVSGQGPFDDLLIDRTPSDTTNAGPGATATAVVTLGTPTGLLFSDALNTSIAGSGDTSAEAEAALSLTLENNTSETIELLFELAYAMQAGVAGRRDAYADALVSLFVDGILLSGANNLFDTIIADQITGPTSVTSADSLRFRLELASGEAALIDLVIGHYGESQVPVPPPLALFAAGLLALAGARRRARIA